SMRRLAGALLLVLGSATAQTPSVPLTLEGDFVTHNFSFRSGEMLPDLRLHGTGGDGHQFLGPQFAGVLFVPGGVLDPAKYYIILPDGIGHGKSSKPSDGLHADFPHYDYDDMVAAEYALVTTGLKVKHLRLVMGTSMGCMHSFIWGETYPDFMDALMPLACLPVQIAGRNRMW